MKRLLLAGAGVGATAWLLPVIWPAAEGAGSTAAAFSGLLALRLALLLDAVVLVALALLPRRSFAREPDSSRTEQFSPGVPSAEPSANVRRPILWLSALTLLALGLRLPGLSADLWLDEIHTVLDCVDTRTAQLWLEFRAAGRHLLHSLSLDLILAATQAGPRPSEWLVRLPALIAGVAGIPALYFTARAVSSSRAALLAAALAAFSYHHIFFSQNARGYTLFLLFSTLATGCLLRALAGRNTRWWASWAVTSILAALSMLLAGFVIAAHTLVIVGLWCLARARSRSTTFETGHAARAVAAVFLATLTAYAPILPSWWSYIRPTYTSEALGFRGASMGHLMVWIDGLAAGFGGLVATGLALLIALCGGALLLRRAPLFCVLLVAPLLLQTTLFVLLGLNFSPRFFLWLLPAAFLALPATIDFVEESAPQRLASRRLARSIAPIALGAFVIVSLASVPRLYQVPKQSSRQSVEWVAESRHQEPVVAIYTARAALRFYGPLYDLQPGRDSRIALAVDDLPPASTNPILLTTFHRALSLEYPDLWRHVKDHYAVVREFPATVRNGEIRVWRLRERSRRDARLGSDDASVPNSGS